MITLGGGGGDENAFLHRVLGPLHTPEARRLARQGMQETRIRSEE